MKMLLLVKVTWSVDDYLSQKEEHLRPLALYLEQDEAEARQDLSDLLANKEEWFTWKLIEFVPAAYSIPLVPVKEK